MVTASDICRCGHEAAYHEPHCTFHALAGTEGDYVRCPCPTLDTGHPDTPALERLQAVELQAGDLIIGTLPAGATRELAEAVATDLETRFPENRTMIVPPGVSVVVMRPPATGWYSTGGVSAPTVNAGLPEGWRLDHPETSLTQALAGKVTGYVNDPHCPPGYTPVHVCAKPVDLVHAHCQCNCGAYWPDITGEPVDG